MTMEERLDLLFESEPENWLDALPAYQKKRVRELIQDSGSVEDAAKKWLSASPEHTFPFGAEQGRSIFLEKVRDEVEKFLCGHDDYEEERKKLLSSADLIQTTVVSSVSAAIASVIGVAAAYVMPVIVLVFMMMGKISLNAWCEMRKDARDMRDVAKS